MKMLQKKESFATLAALITLMLSPATMAQDGLLLDDSINATDADVKVVDDSFKRSGQLTAEQEKILAERKAQMDKRHQAEIRLKEQKRIATQLKAAASATPIVKVIAPAPVSNNESVKAARPIIRKKITPKKRRVTKRKIIRRTRKLSRARKAARDKVQLVQAATQKNVTRVTRNKGVLGGRNLKVIPFGGVANIKKDGIDLSTKVNTGLIIEGEINDRFTVGVGFRYTTLELEDNTSTLNNGFSVFNNTNLGREVEYKGINLEVNSKYFLARKSAFIRPFVGVAAGYNKNNLQYADGGQVTQTVFTTNSLDNEFSSTTLTGSAILGAEANFNETFGAYLAGRYTRALTDGNNGDTSGTTDQDRLNLFGQLIDDANTLALNAGLVIKF